MLQFACDQPQEVGSERGNLTLKLHRCRLLHPYLPINKGGGGYYLSLPVHGLLISASHHTVFGHG